MAAFAAYSLWGLLPIFFKLVHHVRPLEVVAQRVLWSLLLILTLMSVRGGMAALRAVLRDRRLMMPLALSALLIGGNWLTYIWAVNNDHIIAASLGYFLNPLVSVALGVVLLKEKLRRGQMIAVAIAAGGVAIMAATALQTLWISIVLALTFAFYGFVRKVTPVQPMAGLGAETILLAPIALLCLGWIAARGNLAFGHDLRTSALLSLSGAVTMVPLVLFATAARRLPMATLGLLQYLAPTLQFLCGILLFDEKLSHGQMASFGLIWAGLILFAIDSLSAARQRKLATI